MTVSKADMLHEARMAFDAGDHRRGGAILHEIFQQDISHEAAWRLLYAALGRRESLEEFQLDFISRYYPDKIDQFRGVQARGPQKPLRRVSLGIKRSEPEPLKPVNLVDLPAPKPLPAPASRRLTPTPAADTEADQGAFPAGRSDGGGKPLPGAGADETPGGSRSPGTDEARGAAPGIGAEQSSGTRTDVGAETGNKPGLFKRLGSFFRRILPRRRKKQAQAEPSSLEKEKPAEIEDIVQPDSMLAPLSLRDLPRKEDPEPSAGGEKPKRKTAAPLLTKFHEERNEIRLIIADDIQQTRDNIRKLLLFEPSVDVVAVAANGEEAIERALEFEPDIVLMDINMPGMDGLEALKTIRESLPLTQVVMLTVQDDPGYLREALQLGARDYLIKPPTIDELLATIQSTHEIGRAERERVERLYAPPPEPVEDAVAEVDGQAIAVYSPKGGVGCTFIASNLAVALQAEGEEVVLVDGDLEFGGVGLFFNEQARSTIVDLAASVNELDFNLLRDSVIHNQDSGVRLVLAPPSPEAAEKVSGAQLAELIRFLRKRYTHVLVDTGSIMDVHAAAVLSECDQVLFVTTQDIPAINNLRLALDFAPQIGLDESRVSLVLNMYHKRVNITPEQISTNLKRKFAAVIPMDNRTAIPSINRGVPFMTAPDSRAAPIGAAFRELAESLRQVEMVGV